MKDGLPWKRNMWSADERQAFDAGFESGCQAMLDMIWPVADRKTSDYGKSEIMRRMIVLHRARLDGMI